MQLLQNCFKVKRAERTVKNELCGLPLFHYMVTDSTNNRAKEFASDLKQASSEVTYSTPDFAGAIFLADSQTAGRGRLGRSFFSPDKNGIYISYLLKMPQLPLNFITPYAAVAVCRTLEEFLPAEKKVEPHAATYGIKWVNDIFLYEKKVCGILTEGILNPGDSAPEEIVIGIGINLCGTMPEDLDSIAGICSIAAGRRPNVIQSLTENLLSVLQSNSHESQKIFAEYKERSILIGREVDVIPTVGLEEKYRAKVLDIDENYRIVVQKIDESSACKKNIGNLSGKISTGSGNCSEQIALSTGEVSIRL